MGLQLFLKTAECVKRIRRLLSYLVKNGVKLFVAEQPERKTLMLLFRWDSSRGLWRERYGSEQLRPNDFPLYPLTQSVIAARPTTLPVALSQKSAVPSSVFGEVGVAGGWGGAVRLQAQPRLRLAQLKPP
jgi:hypothetical protein